MLRVANFVRSEKIDLPLSSNLNSANMETHENSPIRRMGSHLPQAEDGRFLAFDDIVEMDSRWSAAATELVSLYHAHDPEKLIHSIYIRGSAARGKQIDYLSDLDTVALVDGDGVGIDGRWGRELGGLQSSYPFINGFEVIHKPKAPIMDVKKVGSRFSMLTQYRCINGVSILPSITEKFYPDTDLASILVGGFSEDLARSLRMYPIRLLENPDTKLDYSWGMKRFLRSGMYLVMPSLKRMSKDLYLCYEDFAEIYPAKKDEMYKCLEIAVIQENSYTHSEIMALLESFGGWLKTEIKEKLGVD